MSRLMMVTQVLHAGERAAGGQKRCAHCVTNGHMSGLLTVTWVLHAGERTAEGGQQRSAHWQRQER
jgi:hypothetical protein